MNCRTITLLVLFLAHHAFGAGYDKLVFWSGHYAGMSNAVTSMVNGPEALYFNPSRLAGSNSTELCLNFSPTFAKLNAPVVANNKALPSKRLFLPIGSIFASHAFSHQFAIGIGIYTGGGDKSDFGEVDFGTASTAPIKSSLISTEISLGAGYEIGPGLKLGAAWRVSLISGEFLSALSAGPRTLSSQVTDLGGNNVKGFRIGASYEPTDTWGVGISIRTPVNWELTDGTHKFFSIESSPILPSSSSNDASLNTKLPLLAAFGFHFKPSPVLLAALEYDYMDYHVNREISLTSNSLRALGFPNARAVIQQGWKNGHVIRLGGEYSGIMNWPLRIGYSLSTAVTPEERALYPFIAPGSTHVFDVGAGYEFTSGFNTNWAIEYSRASGEVPAGTTSALAGNYTSDAFSIHLGVNVNI